MRREVASNTAFIRCYRMYFKDRACSSPLEDLPPLSGLLRSGNGVLRKRAGRFSLPLPATRRSASPFFGYC
jgi:hypothetical protein